jgi:hypothetical protein
MDFIIFSFSSEHTLVVVLMQKKDQKTEQPIAFFSRTIRDATLRYNIIENKPLALVKGFEGFPGVHSSFTYCCLCSKCNSQGCFDAE